jgi:hypothetical protein
LSPKPIATPSSASMGHQPKSSALHPWPSGLSDRFPRPTLVIKPHAIPSCWVTQMTIAGLDFSTLTRIFGDSVSVTWERYLKVDKSRQISQWTWDLAKAVGDGTD